MKRTIDVADRFVCPAYDVGTGHSLGGGYELSEPVATPSGTPSR